MYRAIVVVAAFAVSAFAANMFGQTAVNPKTTVIQDQPGIHIGGVREFGPIGITAAMAGPMATVAGAPYSAEAVTQRVQLLSDGNRIEQNTSGAVARDKQGRVRRDEALPGLSSSDGDAPHLVMIEDPVAGVHWTLDARTKTAIKMPFARTKMPPPLGPEKTFFFSTVAPPGPPNIRFLSVPDDSSNVTKADLGMQNIEGVAAKGTKITRTIPTGAMGNALPMIITTETWYSPELKVLVMSKTSDPRMGETTYKLTDIQRAEPAASLFQVPDDYTIKDQPTNNFVYSDAKKE